MMMSEMQSTKAIIALWGQGKVGKTVFASQFPNNRYICVREDGLGSVRSMKKAYNLNFDIPVYMIHNNPTEDPDLIALIGPAFAKQSAWDKLVKLCTVFASKLTENDFITLDHWTYICDALIEHICKKTNHEMQLQDWNTFTGEMKDFLDILKQPMMKASSIILAHDELFKSNLTGEITRSILMPTKMKNSFPSYPTEYLCMKTVVTGAMNVRKVNRRLQSLADQSANTGSYAMIPDIDRPTYEKVRPYLEASLNRKLPEPLWTP
ncbi:MAG TPA: hypothetical protein DD713_03345, partial [Nitrospiraceae bacterium]|nr:hypothetical protein [Nitrospiraceae bacterium]